MACSGGADSVALAAATAFEAPRVGMRAGLVTVDHGLQDGSPAGPRRRPTSVASSASTRSLVRGSGRHRRRTGGRRPHRPLRRPLRRRRPHRMPRRAARRTPSTIRPRPCCWGSGAVGAAVDRRACARSTAAGCARCSGSGGRRPGGLRGRAWRTGTTRTTPTRAFTRVRVRHEVLPAARGRLRRRASPRRWPAPPSCCATTSTRSTAGPPALRRRAPTRPSARTSTALAAPARGASAPGCCESWVGGRRRLTAGQVPRWTRWSPTGTAGPGRPPGRRGGPPGVWQAASRRPVAVDLDGSARAWTCTSRRRHRRGAAHRGADRDPDPRGRRRDRRRLRRPRTAAGRRAQGRRHGHGRPRPGAEPARDDGVHGGVSYGSAHRSSGVVRILKDLDRDIPAGTCWSSRTSSTPG